MHLKQVFCSGRACFSALVALAAASCTLTHSLDDLKGGTLSAPGGSAGVGVAGSAAASGAGLGGSGGAALGGAGGASDTGGAAGNAGDTSTTGLRVISPIEGDAIGWMSPITVQFNQAVDPTTVTAPVDGLMCGTLSLSVNGFTSCVPLQSAPTWSSDHSVTLTPATRLSVGSTYTLRVSKSVSSMSGLSLAADYTVDLSAIYSHTFGTLTQQSQFLDPEEKLGTSTAGYTLYLAWDAQTLYLGMAGSDIANNQQSTVFVAYFGSGSAGSKSGMTIGTQSAALSFAADHGLTWSGDNTQTSLSLLQYSGGWSADMMPAGLNRVRFDSLVQFSIPFSDIGNPQGSLAFASALLYTMTTESTYATVPAGGFNAMKYLSIDLTGKTLPYKLIAQ